MGKKAPRKTAGEPNAWVNVAPRTPKTPGERLAIEISRRFKSRARFEAALSKRNVRGTTRNTLRRYLRDEAEPSTAWIREAAQLLGVREEWLASGSGARTDAEEAARNVRPTEPLIEWVTQRLSAAVPYWSLLSEHARAEIIECWTVLAEGEDLGAVAWREGQEEQLRVQQLVLQLARALGAPLEEIGEPWGAIAVDELEAYTAMLCWSIRLYVRASRRVNTNRPPLRADRLLEEMKAKRDAYKSWSRIRELEARIRELESQPKG